MPIIQSRERRNDIWHNKVFRDFRELRFMASSQAGGLVTFEYKVEQCPDTTPYVFFIYLQPGQPYENVRQKSCFSWKQIEGPTRPSLFFQLDHIRGGRWIKMPQRISNRDWKRFRFELKENLARLARAAAMIPPQRRKRIIAIPSTAADQSG